MRLRGLGLALPLFLLLGCSGEGPGELTRIEVPAAGGSLLPALSRDGDGLIVSWVELQADGSDRLRYARRGPAGWEGPGGLVLPDEASMVLPNWSDPPQVRLLENGDRLAIWSRRRGAGNSFDAILARAPAGEEWSPGSPLSGRRGAGQRGWVSVIPLGGAAFALTWLDVAGASTRLLYQRWEAGAAGPPETLDDDVCPWCHPSAVLFGGRPVVAYRDHASGQVRDVTLLRRGGAGWEPARPIHADGWATAGCPVSGPALARCGDRLGAAWFSASGDEPRVVVATSEDGASFGEPVRVDGGDPVGRVALEGWDDGSLFVSWLERDGEEAELRLRRMGPDGTLDEPITLGRTKPGPPGGFPRMARDDARVYLAWTRPGPPAAVRLVSIRP